MHCYSTALLTAVAWLGIALEPEVLLHAAACPEANASLNLITIKSELSRKERDVGATGTVNTGDVARYRTTPRESSNIRTAEAVLLHPRSSSLARTVATRSPLSKDHATSRKPTSEIKLRRKVRPAGARIQRDLYEDACKWAKEMRNDVRDQDVDFDIDPHMKSSRLSLANFLDSNADNVSSRYKRDVNGAEQRLKERREKQHKQADELRKLRKLRAERRAKMAEERQRLHSRPVRDLQHHTYTSGLRTHQRSPPTPKRADEPKTRQAGEEKRNKRAWKNHIAGKDLKEDIKSHFLHKRDVEQMLLNADFIENRLKKSSLDNEISDEMNELSYYKPIKADKHHDLTQATFGTVSTTSVPTSENSQECDSSSYISDKMNESSYYKPIKADEHHDLTLATFGTGATTSVSTSENSQECDSSSYFSYLWCWCKTAFSYAYNWFTG